MTDVGAEKNSMKLMFANEHGSVVLDVIGDSTDSVLANAVELLMDMVSGLGVSQADTGY